jgi:hypothetical protein
MSLHWIILIDYNGAPFQISIEKQLKKINGAEFNIFSFNFNCKLQLHLNTWILVEMEINGVLLKVKIKELLLLNQEWLHFILKTMKVKYILKWNTKFWKIHYIVKYDLILIFFFLKWQAKLDFFQNGRSKNSTRQIPVIPGKTKTTKINFPMNFVRALFSYCYDRKLYFAACL